MANDDSEDQIDDTHLFRSAVTGSRRLKSNKVGPFRTRLKPVPVQRLADEKQVLQATLDPASLDQLIEQGDELLYAQAGVQHSVMKKLRRGQFAIEAELDLHRMTSEKAYVELMDFIAQCQKQHIRCVRVIHGKGYGSKDKIPVLKTKVNSWLRQWQSILAFCSARRCDGGNGAVYVLLKRL
jgi:DNA-nicking Smr family endonuclease